MTMSDLPTPDGRLVQRMAAGDRRAQQELSQRHRLSVYAQVYALLIDPSAADEVVVATFDQAWRSANQFNPGTGTPLAWLSEIARALAQRRKRRPTPRPRRSRPIP
jgi:RNA polymerase sigma-70 factor (ECF subfamily)